MPDVRIVTRDSTTGVLSIGIPRPPQYIKGIELLVQIVTIELLSSPGRDINNPTYGGNLRSLIGSSIGYDDEAEIYAEIKMMVQTAEKNIRQMQQATSRSSNEKLSRLDLIDVVPDEENLQLEIIIRIISMDQQETEAIVGLK